MIENIIIISLLVFGIWYTMLPGEIFGFVNKLLDKWPEKLKQPLFACPVCMVPWYGSAAWWAIPWEAFGFWPTDRPVIEWAITMVASMGLNYILLAMTTKEEKELPPIGEINKEEKDE